VKLQPQHTSFLEKAVDHAVLSNLLDSGEGDKIKGLFGRAVAQPDDTLRTQLFKDGLTLLNSAYDQQRIGIKVTDEYKEWEAQVVKVSPPREVFF
jgi:hypothetical protein